MLPLRIHRERVRVGIRRDIPNLEANMGEGGTVFSTNVQTWLCRNRNECA